jgi:hypothetical protein
VLFLLFTKTLFTLIFYRELQYYNFWKSSIWSLNSFIFFAQLNSFETRVEPNCMFFFVRKGWTERKKTEVKKRVTQVANWKFLLKIQLSRAQLHFFLVREGWIERKGAKMKKAGNIRGGLKIFVKDSFGSPIFFSY